MILLFYGACATPMKVLETPLRFTGILSDRTPSTSNPPR